MDAPQITEATRAQLVALGISRERHRPAALAEFFPKELNVSATQMSAEDLARVLIYLVEENVFSLPDLKRYLPVKKVKPGWHFCQFYRDFEQLLDFVGPYIAKGLRNGEGCLWVLPDSLPIYSARDALARSLPIVDAYLGSGQLELMSHKNWYLDTKGRLKSFEEIAAALLERQDRALTKGYKFLRAAGDTGWVSGTEQSRNFIDYEMKINEGLRDTQVAAVCTYRADVTSDELAAIVTAHQDALYRAPAR